MPVGTDEVEDPVPGEEPRGLLDCLAVVAEETRRVGLQEPTALPEPRCDARIGDDDLRALRMRDHGDVARALNVPRESLSVA